MYRECERKEGNTRQKIRIERERGKSERKCDWVRGWTIEKRGGWDYWEMIYMYVYRVVVWNRRGAWHGWMKIAMRFDTVSWRFFQITIKQWL